MISWLDLFITVPLFLLCTFSDTDNLCSDYQKGFTIHSFIYRMSIVFFNQKNMTTYFSFSLELKSIFKKGSILYWKHHTNCCHFEKKCFEWKCGPYQFAYIGKVILIVAKQTSQSPNFSLIYVFHKNAECNNPA